MDHDVKLKKSLLGKHSLAYACPNCGARLTSPVDDAGTQDSCPDCGRPYVVPEAKHKANLAAIREAEQRKQNEAAQTKKLENEQKREAAVRKRDAENSAARKRAELNRERQPPVAPIGSQQPLAPVAATGLRACPFCAETIQAVAVKCKHCGEFLDGRQTVQAQPQAVKAKGNDGCGQIMVIAFGIVLAVIILMFL